jgi:hypothetical protein
MQTFAKRVCGLPEVKCVTYSELMAFMNDNKDKIPSFQAGGFTKMTRPPSSEAVDVSATFTDEERAAALAAHAHNDEGIDAADRAAGDATDATGTGDTTDPGQ